MAPKIENDLPPVKRYISTHDTKGQPVFTTGKTLTEEIPWEGVGGNRNYGLAYTTSNFPVKYEDEDDVKRYEHHVAEKTGMIVKGGTLVRYVDYAPGIFSAQHRTISLDYGIVLEGQIEAVMESGETRLLNRGDITVQRATMHGWRNPSEMKWARMVFIMMESQAPIVNGEALKEDYGKNMAGIIKPST